MTVKQWLSRGYHMDKEINALICARDKAFVLECRVSGVGDAERVQTSKMNRQENRFVEYANYTKEIEERLEKLCTIRKEIQNAIYRLDDVILRTVLIERYINFKTWEEIAEGLDYSDKWVRERLHSVALCEVGKYIGLP